jgi:hypothetical protein
MKRLLLFLLLVSAACPKLKKDTSPDNDVLKGPSVVEVIEDPFVSDDARDDSKREEESGGGDGHPTDEKSMKKPAIADPLPSMAPQSTSSPLGTVIAELVPHPGREMTAASGAKVLLVSLVDLSKSKNEKLMIDKRSSSPSRESLSDMKVIGTCTKNACTDGLFDQKSDFALIKDQPSQEEINFTKDGWVERLLRIVTVGEGHTSIYLARVAGQGNEKKQALLECATYSRSTGKRLSLEQVLPPQRAASMIREAKGVLGDQYPGYEIDPRSFLLMGQLPKGIRLCALPPVGTNNATILEILL